MSLLSFCIFFTSHNKKFSFIKTIVGGNYLCPFCSYAATIVSVQKSGGIVLTNALNLGT